MKRLPDSSRGWQLEPDNMAKDRSLVRASDIGAWSFCNRAWWLSVVKHAEHAKPAVLARGTASHESHGQSVMRASRLRRAGFILLLLSVLAILLLAILVITGGT